MPTKGIMVTGQYGTGKTETIKGLIRSAANENPGIRIGAFVTESANIALDAKRYNIGDDATGVSFASVCCPTVTDMRQAISTALDKKNYDLLFLEPPGNMHPPLMAQVAVEKGIELEHVVMLVSERDFKDDKYAATFQTGLEIASIVGITHRLSQISTKYLDAEMIKFIESANASAPIISFDRGGLSYSEIQRHMKWSMDRMAGITEIGHSDHYHEVLRVLNPELPYEEISYILKQIAETGTVSRGKGQIPKYGKQFDLKGNALEITDCSLNKNGMGCAVFFAKNELPLELIDKVSMAPEQKTKQLIESAPEEAKFAIFARLYKESQNTVNFIANGEVTHTYSPVDQAERVATEIFNSGDDSALRMILRPYHQIRLNALEELKERPKNSQNAFIGVIISSTLINSSMASEKGGPDYTKLADQHLLIKIKNIAIPALLLYSKHLGKEEITNFPRYGVAAGPYIFNAAKIAWDNLDKSLSEVHDAKQDAKSNMVTVHSNAGFTALTELWRNW